MSVPASAPLRLLVLAMAALIVTGCAGATERFRGQGAASCEAAVVHAHPETVIPGQPVTLTGTAWEPCNDTPNERADAPWPSVMVEWIRKGRSTDLGTIDVANGAFSDEVVVPRDAEAGRASVRVSGPDFSVDVVVEVVD